jgi:hypothetical protein
MGLEQRDSGLTAFLLHQAVEQGSQGLLIAPWEQRLSGRSQTVRKRGCPDTATLQLVLHQALSFQLFQVVPGSVQGETHSGCHLFGSERLSSLELHQDLSPGTSVAEGHPRVVDRKRRTHGKILSKFVGIVKSNNMIGANVQLYIFPLLTMLRSGQ